MSDIPEAPRLPRPLVSQTPLQYRRQIYEWSADMDQWLDAVEARLIKQLTPDSEGTK